MQQSILQQGVDLMLYGMGTVFLFLTILVIATSIMSLFIKRYFPDAVVPQRTPSSTSATASPAADTKLLTIIQAAIKQHRDKK